MGAREPNGRLSRRVVHAKEREEMTQREAQSVAIAARMRVFGLTEAQARGQDGGTVIGRMHHAKELTSDQVEAGFVYLEARNAYHRAIGVASDTGVAPLPEAKGSGTYEEFCEAAIKRWTAVTDVLTCVMVEVRSPAPAAALDNFVVRDMYVEHLVGDLRIALNALHRHFTSPSKGGGMVPALKPIPPRYKNGERVRKSRKYAGAMASVYVVECPAAQAVKVGCSASPIARTRDLNTEIGQELFLRWHAEATRADAMRIEKAFHDANKGQIVHAVGEWYKRGAEAAIVEVIRIAADLGVALDQHGEVSTLNGADVMERERSVVGQPRQVALDPVLFTPYIRQ